MPVGLVLAGLATADLVIKYGKELVRLCSSFRNAGREIQERIIIIESTWLKAQYQIEFLTKIWKTLDVTHQEQQSQILDILETKLKAAIVQVQRVQRRHAGREDDIKRWKYALVKDSIDNAIEGLEVWQKIFDPSWYLIMRMASRVIDEELQEVADEPKVGTMSTALAFRRSLKSDRDTKVSVFLPKDGLVDALREPIPYSTAELMRRSPTSDKWYIVDSVPCLPDVSARTLTEDVRDLARKLSATDPMAFGLLQCRGVVRILKPDQRTPASFDFVFYEPGRLKAPRSLRDILLFPDTDISLSIRFSIAQTLAQSISYVHTCNFVHKGIRPETILVFEDERSVLSGSFLVGFEKFRTVSGYTLRAGDCAWEKNLYRHPRRQGLQPEDEYVMQHDIYSLGVCLLEVGLWQSLVLYGPAPSASGLLQSFLNESEDNCREPGLLKDHLVDLAKRSLPCRMGDKYTDVVVNCLTCLDEDNMDFGDQTEFEDEDGILVGVRYIEKVLVQLNNISI
ncbi:uncharacterized protein EI97DRAFT_247271 [Westerdykella ornata]|uniref:Protein kinase domain-containing protein n=1 Tax=Westerdykella ornata TaxID=318751 RepID=A0A6A6JR34_WESOR|nr:uncharacterized protein EI97DRAFT_247271 [Westerdykella ornata]KAF2278166.1 hypothetical protein EI97DRAFT_247271 [Westerdykella ornata]